MVAHVFLRRESSEGAKAQEAPEERQYCNSALHRPPLPLRPRSGRLHTNTSMMW
jgi:hypothetical protein